MLDKVFGQATLQVGIKVYQKQGQNLESVAANKRQVNNSLMTTEGEFEQFVFMIKLF